VKTIEEIEAEIRKYDTWVEKVLAYDGKWITIQAKTRRGERWVGTYPVVQVDECA
jgi:hypothetical protein